MKKVLAIACLFFTLMGCNTIEEKEAELPAVHNLTFESFETTLPKVNITVSEEEWKYMITRPHAKIYTRAGFSFKHHKELVNVPIQLRIKGAASVEYSLKSLEIIFDEVVNNDDVRLIGKSSYNGNVYLDELKNIRLRNSGQDFTKTMLKDKAYTRLAELSGMDFMVMQTGSAAQVFVNDKYYGLLNIRSESNLMSIALQEKSDPENVVVYKVDVDNGNIEHSEGDMSLTPDLEQMIDDADPVSIAKWVNEASFIDYIIFQDYSGNLDWPHNNIRVYSVDGKPFRFVLYDLDHAARKTKNPLLPELEYVSHDLAKMYRVFRRIKGFDERLKKRQEELYEIWQSGRFYDIVEEMRIEIKESMPYQISKHQNPVSVYQWNWHIEKLMRDFEMRDKYIRKKYKL